jgi:Putative MetA-pathway of phenol degradation
VYCQYLQLFGLPSVRRLVKMRCLAAESRTAVLLFSVCFFAGICHAQDLAPRAYVITPLHSNAVNLTYSFLDGSIIFDGTVPIADATARVNISILSISHSMNFFGRTANFTASLPYGVGNFRGTVAEAETLAYRSGLLTSSFRFSVNLKGGPAMNVQEYSKWRQKTIIGVSIKLVPPSGQYDPTKLINYGSNRWALKPELGYSRRLGHWILDGYGGVWFFTTNSEFFSHNQFSPGTNTQSQNPTGSFEGHLSYDFKPRLWVSFDANFWFGGSTSLNGAINEATLQRNSRIGATASIPLSRHQAIKLSYNNGAYIRYGGSYQNVSVGWQYSWLGRPD